MIVKALKTKIFQEGESLAAFVSANIKKLSEKSIVVVTSKIVALAEKRTAIIKNEKDKERIIRAESDFAVKTKYIWLTIKDGNVMASAGVDESNANGKVILLPKDSFQAAHTLRKQLRHKFGVKELGVLITDSRTLPLRAGIAGVSLGYAGFGGVRDYRGTTDLFGRKLTFSRTDIADSLASAAVLVMGEGDEKQPLAIITGTPVQFSEKVKRHELDIDPFDDMYRPLFTKMKKK